MLSNLTLTPKDRAIFVSWSIPFAKGNAIILKWRTSSITPWSKASEVELSSVSTNYTISNLTNGQSYEVQVSQVQFYSGVSITATPIAPPPPIPTPPALRLGVINATDRGSINNNSIGKAILNAGIAWDRIDVGDGTNLSALDQAVAMGYKAIVLYNPGTGMSGGLNNKTASQVGSEVKALAQKLLASYPGMTEIELGNEVWWNGDIPSSYAAKYAAAKQACAGLGVTLIAMVTGDYLRGDGTWSADKGGGGWIRDFWSALQGVKVDAWAAHPYPPNSVLTSTNHEDSGWPALKAWHDIAVSLGSNAPWYITEVGLKISELGSQSAQASGLTQMLDSLKVQDPSIPGTPFSWIVFWAWYSSTDDGSGDWGLFENTGSQRVSFSALQQWASMHGPVK